MSDAQISDKQGRGLTVGWRDPADPGAADRTMAELIEPTGDDPPPPAAETPRTYRTRAVWELYGPAGVGIDRLLMLAVETGLQAEVITAGTRYRVWGSMDALQSLAGFVADWAVPGTGLQPEAAPPGLRLAFKLAPARPPVRSAIVHGTTEPERAVARAIDAGLQARVIGLQRFVMTGPSRLHLVWLQLLFEVPQARALEIMGTTLEALQAEDTAVPMPEIVVNLPTRQTTSEIERDMRGEITRVTQTERSVDDGNP